MDYRKMFDANFVGSWDLPPEGTIVRIEKVTGETLVAEGNKKTRKPVIKFHGTDKRFAVNKTNGKVTAQLYGNDTTKWIDKLLAIYPTTTKFGRDTVDCIRVRPQVPKGKADTSSIKPGDTRPANLRPTEEEQGERMREPGEEG